MSLPSSLRYRRQLGLVHQRRLEAARVLVAGGGPVRPYLLQNLALLGFGKGSGEIRLLGGDALAAEDLPGQFLWSERDCGLGVAEASTAALEPLAGDFTLTEARHARGIDLAIELEPGALGALGDVPVLRGRTSPLGLCAGRGDWPDAAPMPARNLFTPALAACCGALLAQEALRALGLLRPCSIERARVAIVLDLAEGGDTAGLEARYDGLGPAAGLTIDERQGTEGGRTLRIVLPPELDILGQVLERLDLVQGAYPEALAEPRTLAHESPFERMTAERERGWLASAAAGGTGLAGKRVVLAGLGGLGSWIAPLLAVSGLEDLTLVLVDRDRVEAHNLNRQVLYAASDIGRPKAEAAAAALTRLDRGSAFPALPAEVSLGWLLAEGGELARSDLVVSAFDNAYARYVLGMWAHERGLVFLDSGGGGLDGNVNLYRPEDHCILCHWGTKRSVAETWAFARRREARRCQVDEASSPLIGGALVTTSAVIASLTAAVALAVLAGGPTPAHQITYLAKPDAIRRCPIQERFGHQGCSHHRHGENHERHLQAFREEGRHLDALVTSGASG